jgi:hypothetical protein
MPLYAHWRVRKISSSIFSRNHPCNTLCVSSYEKISKNGKIATCAQVFAARHFNEYFNQDMEIADENFIDIYKASSLDEILEFVIRPIPFCKYCCLKKIKRGIKWETSKKEITEWTQPPPPPANGYGTLRGFSTTVSTPPCYKLTYKSRLSLFKRLDRDKARKGQGFLTPVFGAAL